MTVPPYMRIVEHIRSSIENGDLHSGQRLPSIKEIAREHGVALETASKAIRLLQGDGHVHSTNQGTFVKERDVSNYEKRTCLNGVVLYGPENTNGTGQVYLDADRLPRWLNQGDVRELAQALLEAADDAQRNQWRIEER